MKTILYIYHTSNIGGGSFCLLNILKTVDRRLFKPVVLLKNDGLLVEEIKALDIDIYFLSKLHTVPYNVSTLTPRKLWNAYSIITGFTGYKQILREVKPDIVYINTMMLYPYLRLAKKMGIKTIIHIREHWPEKEHIWQRKIALQYIDKYADHIIAINSYSASMLDFSLKPKTIVYDWIDMSKRYEERPMSEIFREPMDGKKVYLYMGGMQPIKGAKEVITSFTKVVKSPNARLLVMGISSNSYSRGWKGKVKNVLSKLGYTAYTEAVLNAISKDKRIICIPGTYKIKHILQQTYCILSYFTIPHANLALAESIILGTPTIAAATSESREYSLEGSMASLFAINNINEFECAIRNFENERLQILANIQKNSDKIKYMFDSEKNSRKLDEIYKAL